MKVLQKREQTSIILIVHIFNEGVILFPLTIYSTGLRLNIKLV